MADDHRMMLAVDDSEYSRKAAAYVADVLGGTDRVLLSLLHVLPPIPPSLLEHGGQPDPAGERAVERELDVQTAKWREGQEREAAPLMHSIREILEAGGVPGDRIEAAFTAPLPGEAVGPQILRKALEMGCRTVVLGRAPRPWWSELFHRHPSGALMRRPAAGLTVWVIE